MCLKEAAKNLQTFKPTIGAYFETTMRVPFSSYLISGFRQCAFQRIFPVFFLVNSILLCLIWQNTTDEIYKMVAFFYTNTAARCRPLVLQTAKINKKTKQM